ncbi:hypothetical protein [Kitasatospora sp. NPDC056181]|uniref:hypothetical protein n=1 Tax=Kitasatospora sp. NPDC056181 TaxID=3345737 RepID=UPI0035E245AD
MTYERGSGGHVAERLRPVPGSDEAAALEAMAADPASDWHAVPDPEPEEPPAPAESRKTSTRKGSA